MSKRAERRHHEERVKSRFREVAKRWAGSIGGWVNRWYWAWTPDGKWRGTPVVDRTGEVRRLRFIEETAVKLAHHNKCDCGACKRQRYRDHRHHERVLDKIYIEEETGDDE